MKAESEKDQFLTVLQWLAIISLLFTLISAALLPRCYHRNASATWPTTIGVIRETALQTTFKKPRMTTFYSPFICYSYTVESVPRAGIRIAFSDAVRLPKDDALAWIATNFPVGKQVTVYYDPKNPDLAVVTPGAKELVFNCWSSTLTAAACAAASLFFLHRRRGGALTGSSRSI